MIKVRTDKREKKNGLLIHMIWIGPPGPPGNPATVSPSAFIGIYLPRAVLTSSTGSVFRPSTSTAIPNVRVVAPATGVTVGVVGGSSGLGSSASTVSITGGDIVLNGVDLDSTYEATVYVAGHFNVGSPNVTFALAALKTGSSQYVVLPNSMFTVCLEEHSFARQYTFYFNVSNQIVNQTGSSNTMTIRLVAFAGQNPYTGNPTDTVPPGNGTTPDIVFGYDHAVTIHVKQLQ